MRKREKIRITIETDEWLKVLKELPSEGASFRTARETMHCGEPRCILKYMHAYHMSHMAASSRTRLTLPLSLTVSLTLIQLLTFCIVMKAQQHKQKCPNYICKADHAIRNMKAMIYRFYAPVVL